MQTVPSRLIYTAVGELLKSNKPIDPMTVSDHLSRTTQLPTPDMHVMDHVTYMASSAMFDYYLELVLRDAAIRAASEECVKLQKELAICKESSEVQVMLAGAFTKPMDICKPPPSRDTDRSLLMEYVDSIELLATGNGQTKKPDVAVSLRLQPKRRWLDALVRLRFYSSTSGHGSAMAVQPCAHAVCGHPHL